MRLGAAIAAVLLCCWPRAAGAWRHGRARLPSPISRPPRRQRRPTRPLAYLYVVRYDHWSEADERGFGEFIAAIGDSGCAHGRHLPARAGQSVPRQRSARASSSAPTAPTCPTCCASTTPGSAACRSAMSATSSRAGTRATSATRRTATPSRERADARKRGRQRLCDHRYAARRGLVGDLSHPSRARGSDDPISIRPRSTRNRSGPGTVIYDPNGHLATVYRVEADGRIHYIDAHPDNSLTRGFYDLRFVRASPGMGAGFKNWRPMRLDRRHAGRGRHASPAAWSSWPANKDIADILDEQFFGNGTRPDDDRDWRDGAFTLNGETLDYYDYVRAKLAGGKLRIRSAARSARHGRFQLRRPALPRRRRDRGAGGGPAEPARARPAAGKHLRHRRRLGDLFVAVARCAAQDRVQGIARHGRALRAHVRGPTIRTSSTRARTSPPT